MNIKHFKTVVYPLFFFLFILKSILFTDIYASPIPVQSHSSEDDGIVFVMEQGRMKLMACADNIIRVTYSPTESFSTRQSLIVSNSFDTPPSWNIDETSTTVTMSTAKMKAEVTLSTGAIKFTDNMSNVLIQEDTDGGKEATQAEFGGESVYSISQIFSITEDEGIYGLGEYDNDNVLNRNVSGKSVRIMVANRDKPIPFMISTNQYGLLWDNYSDTYFNFSGSGERTLTINSEVADEIDYYIVYGEELDSVISGYRTITGPAPLFPKFAYGFWHSRERYKTQEEVETFSAEFRSRNIPIDIIVQDWQWWQNETYNDGSWNCMIWDSDRYPDPAGMCNTVHGLNMHIAVSVWPTLGVNSAIYSDFDSRGWILPVLYGYGNARVYDTYNTEASDLFWDYMNNAVWSKGIDVWWIDGSEPECGEDEGDNQTDLKGALTRQGSNALGTFYRYLNGFSLTLASHIYRNQREQTSNKRVCMLTRSVYAGQQRYGAISWVGDAQCEWAQYKRELAGGMNFCAAGVPYWTTDPGAFYPAFYAWSGGIGRDEFKEIYTRWFQFVSFCPIFRSHGTWINREMWLFGDPGTPYFDSQLKFDKLRYRLLPYIYSIAWKVTSEGYTIMRALPFDFRSDKKTYSISTQYMFGPAFLVNPIVDSTATSRSLYLPSGTDWFDFWTGEQMEGGQNITAQAPISSMPLYIHAGSIVPMGPMNLQYATEKPADPIELRVYTGADGQFTLYEDENDNYNYETGTYATIPISWDETSRKLTIGARNGNFPGMLENRTFNVIWVRNDHGKDIGWTSPSDSDRVVDYIGDEVTVSPTGGISVQYYKSNFMQRIWLNITSTVVTDKIVLPHELNGKFKSIELYDLRGKLLQKLITKDNVLNLRKDFGISNGIHLMQVKSLPNAK